MSSEPAPGSVGTFFTGRRVFVTGGTGSFGHQIVSALAALPVAEAVIFSRDEAKQDAMHHLYAEDPRVRFVIGDVRDAESVRSAMAGCDVVYHAAALKQVPSCEFHPLEAVMTNVLGAENVRRAAIANGAEVMLAISTDKAVKPVNAMGMSKALQEKLVLSPGARNGRTRMVCVRYGNVVASRGSVVPYFVDLAREGKPLRVTDPNMTRFLLTLPQAIELVMRATAEAATRTLWVRKLPAATVADIARAVGIAVRGDPSYPTQIVGARPGEKIHEVLVSEEEMRRSRELPEHFVVSPSDAAPPDVAERPGRLEEYTSATTRRLSADEVVPLLQGLLQQPAPRLAEV